MKREQAVEYVQQLKRDIHEAGKILREQGPEALTRFKAELLGQHWDRDGNIFDRYQRPSGFIWEIPAEYNPGPKTPKSAWDDALCDFDLRVHQKIADSPAAHPEPSTIRGHPRATPGASFISALCGGFDRLFRVYLGDTPS